MDNLQNLTIKKVHEGLLNKDFSALELTQAYFARIKKEDAKVNAYLSLAEDSAVREAEAVDLAIAKDEPISAVAGVPLAIKDNILIKGLPATAASKMLEHYVASYDAGVIAKLKRQRAVFLGKSNLDEFAMGSSTENSAFKITHNPHDLTRVPGGTSGGSAAAVAANMALAALGSDTGGSIRQPSAFCGVVGLKPTYGAVSRSGVIAMASSLDQVGPVAKTVEDAAILFKAIAGSDPLDATSSKYYDDDHDDELLNPKWEKLKKLTIGLPEEYFVPGTDPAVIAAVERAIEKLKAMGIRFKKISLPHAKYALSAYYIIMPAEVSANLARFDGIRYGRIENGKSQKLSGKWTMEEIPRPSGSFPPANGDFLLERPRYSSSENLRFRLEIPPEGRWPTFQTASKIENLAELYLKQKGMGFGAEAKRRIMLGTFVLSSGYYDAYYEKAQKVRKLVRNDFDEAFKDVDVILTPVTPTSAFKIGEKIDDPLSMYLSDIFTIAVNLAGLPAASIPVDGVRSQESGVRKELPIGFQLIGKKWREADVLGIGRYYEESSNV